LHQYDQCTDRRFTTRGFVVAGVIGLDRKMLAEQIEEVDCIGVQLVRNKRSYLDDRKHNHAQKSSQYFFDCSAGFD
jgi:hypothetical protein